MACLYANFAASIPVLTFASFNCRSEMVFLPDLSDGETSDGGAGRDNFDGPGRTSSGILNFDDDGSKFDENSRFGVQF